MIPEAWVINIGEVATKFYQRIEELEDKIIPSTPAEVLEERRRTVEEDVHHIQEAKSLCTKAYA